MFVTFKIIGDKDLAKRIQISFAENSFTLSWDDENLTIALGNAIDSELSQSYPFSQKLELKLFKLVPNTNWLSLEPGHGLVSAA